MTDDDVLDLLQRIKIRWPSFKIPDDLDMTVEVYLEDLAEFSYEDVKAAYRSLRGSEFAPSLASVRQAIADAGRLPLSDALEQAHALAFYLDQAQFNNGSGYQPHKPKVDEAVESTLRAVGISSGWEWRFQKAWRENA